MRVDGGEEGVLRQDEIRQPWNGRREEKGRTRCTVSSFDEHRKDRHENDESDGRVGTDETDEETQHSSDDGQNAHPVLLRDESASLCFAEAAVEDVGDDAADRPREEVE